jgi:DNA uptake protein ComE-like DNA-binding protein
VQNQILRDPRVIVTTQQFGYSVTVMGEVRSPGIYTLAGQKRLIDMLTEAGRGDDDRAGHVIEIFAAGSMKNPQTVLWDPTLRENDNAELEIKTGETILVSRCGVVYVGGNVGRPGAFPLCDSNHTTSPKSLPWPREPSQTRIRNVLSAANLGKAERGWCKKSNSKTCCEERRWTSPCSRTTFSLFRRAYSRRPVRPL